MGALKIWCGTGSGFHNHYKYSIISNICKNKFVQLLHLLLRTPERRELPALGKKQVVDWIQPPAGTAPEFSYSMRRRGINAPEPVACSGAGGQGHEARSRPLSLLPACRREGLPMPSSPVQRLAIPRLQRPQPAPPSAPPWPACPPAAGWPRALRLRLHRLRRLRDPGLEGLHSASGGEDHAVSLCDRGRRPSRLAELVFKDAVLAAALECPACRGITARTETP